VSAFIRDTLSRFIPKFNEWLQQEIENHDGDLAVFYMYYNFGRASNTQEAGIADHIWSAEEVVGLLDKEALATV